MKMLRLPALCLKIKPDYLGLQRSLLPTQLCCIADNEDISQICTRHRNNYNIHYSRFHTLDNRKQCLLSNMINSNANKSVLNKLLLCECRPPNLIRQVSDTSQSQSNKDSKELSKTTENPYAALTTAEKVREAGKDVTYTAIIIVGIGVTGFMFWAIFRELMSGESPTGVYRKAFKKCKQCLQITDMLGEPLKGYGEQNRRGRRRLVRHTEYEVDGIKHMRVRFYIEGPRGKGTVNLEVKKGEDGWYQYRYLFVELDDFPQRTIILEDNR